MLKISEENSRNNHKFVLFISEIPVKSCGPGSPCQRVLRHLLPRKLSMIFTAQLYKRKVWRKSKECEIIHDVFQPQGRQTAARCRQQDHQLLLNRFSFTILVLEEQTVMFRFLYCYWIKIQSHETVPRNLSPSSVVQPKKKTFDQQLYQL